MEQELGNLPPSSSEYWQDANINLNQVKEPVTCEHHMQLMKAREIKCVKCGMGLFIGIDDVVKDGHLIHAGKRII